MDNLTFISIDVCEIFEHWAKKMKKKNAILDDYCYQAIELALRKYSPKIIKQAIDRCAALPWYNGNNNSGKKLNNIGYILKNSKTIENLAGIRQNEKPKSKNEFGLFALPKEGRPIPDHILKWVRQRKEKEVMNVETERTLSNVPS